MDALDEEWCTGFISNDDADAESAFQTFQTLQSTLLPLFSIESNLLKLLSPDLGHGRKMSIRAGYDWKAMLYSKTKLSAGSPVSSEDYDSTPFLEAQRRDIISLWRNPTVQEILARRCSSIKCSSGL